MKLTDLDATFLKRLSDSEYQMVESLAEADGVQFQCPKCAQGKEVCEDASGRWMKRDAEGNVTTGTRRFVRGAHYVICWFVGKVPDHLNPKPGRWNPSGTGLSDLTFVEPRAISVLMTGPG